MKTAEKIVLALIFVLLIAGVFVALRYIDFLNVKEIDATVHGPVSKVSIEMQRIINPLKGRNILEINLRSLKKTLLSFDGVSEVEVRRYYPDKLILGRRPQKPSQVNRWQQRRATTLRKSPKQVWTGWNWK